MKLALSNNARGLLKVLSVLVVFPAVLLVGYLWDEFGDRWGPYWERLESIYDPKLKAMRCLDENRELIDMEPPCLVMTSRGHRTVNQWQNECERNGGNEEVCMRQAVERLTEYQPGKKVSSTER
jgi:hypothetical protein